MVAGNGGVTALLPPPVVPVELDDDAAFLKPAWVIFTTPEREGEAPVVPVEVDVPDDAAFLKPPWVIFTLELEEDGVLPPPLLPLSLADVLSSVVLVVTDDGDADLLPEDVDDGSSWVLGPPVGRNSLLLGL